MTSLPRHLAPLESEPELLDPAVISAHQRDRIIEAAIPLFAKRGYRGTTVDHIVAAAKVGVRTFYENFDNRESCFLAVYERTIAEAREAVAAAVDPDASWGAQACTALRVVLERISEDQQRARIALFEVQTAGQAALAAHAETVDLVAPFLARGRSESPVAAELPPRLEVAIVGGLTWFLQQRILPGEFEDVATHLREACEIAIEPYLGAEATRRLADEAAPERS